MIRSLLNWIFNHIKERPTDEQLIAYGRQLEREAQHQPPATRQRGYAQSAWNSEPERHTDKPAIITPNPRGAYYQKRRKEFLEIREQPAVSRTFTTRKLHMQRYDGPPLPDETLHRCEAWLL